MFCGFLPVSRFAEAGGLRSITRMELAKATEPKQEKLLDRVRSAIRLRHYSPRNEESYWGWIRRYIVFHRMRHPAEMGDAEVRHFLAHLAQNRAVRRRRIKH
jgi:hypothetical protein